MEMPAAALPLPGDLLRAVMRKVPSPVTVVTAAGPDETRGATIGSFTSVSLSPPLISFNVRAGSRMHDVLLSAPAFGVHVLGGNQAGLSARFAASNSAGSEQFSGLSFQLDEKGTPILEGAAAVLLCRKYAVYPAGDHSIILGEVVAVEQEDGQEPLLYYNRSYRGVGAELPQASAA